MMFYTCLVFPLCCAAALIVGVEGTSSHDVLYPQAKEYEGLTVMDSAGRVLRDYNVVKPGNDVTVRFLVPFDAAYSRVVLYHDDDVIANTTIARRERRDGPGHNRTDIIVHTQPGERDSWMTLVAQDEQEITLGSTILEVDGLGPYMEEPEDQCGIHWSDNKFKCAIHPAIKGQLFWYLQVDDATIWVATDKDNYRNDLVQIKTKQREGQTYESTLSVLKTKQQRKVTNVNCGLLGHRTSRVASYYHPVLERGEVALIIAMDARVLQDNEEIQIGDKIILNVTTPRGNPIPGLRVLINDEVVRNVSKKGLCGTHNESNSLSISYTISQRDGDQLKVSATMFHPLSTGKKSTVHILKIKPNMSVFEDVKDDQSTATGSSPAMGEYNYMVVLVFVVLAHQVTGRQFSPRPNQANFCARKKKKSSQEKLPGHITDAVTTKRICIINKSGVKLREDTLSEETDPDGKIHVENCMKLMLTRHAIEALLESITCDTHDKMRCVLNLYESEIYLKHQTTRSYKITWYGEPINESTTCIMTMEPLTLSSSLSEPSRVPCIPMSIETTEVHFYIWSLDKVKSVLHGNFSQVARRKRHGSCSGCRHGLINTLPEWQHPNSYEQIVYRNSSDEAWVDLYHSVLGGSNYLPRMYFCKYCQCAEVSQRMFKFTCDIGAHAKVMHDRLARFAISRQNVICPHWKCWHYIVYSVGDTPTIIDTCCNETSVMWPNGELFVFSVFANNNEPNSCQKCGTLYVSTVIYSICKQGKYKLHVLHIGVQIKNHIKQLKTSDWWVEVCLNNINRNVLHIYNLFKSIGEYSILHILQLF